MAESKYPSKPNSVTAPKRTDTSHYKLEWKQPSNYTDEKKGWKKVQIFFKTWRPGAQKGKRLDKDGKAVNISTTECTRYISRGDYYPTFNETGSNKKRNPKLEKITAFIKVTGRNKKKVKSKETELVFKLPKNPQCEFDYDDTTGLLTMTCKVTKDDIADCYDCAYVVYRQDTKTNSSYYKDGKKKIALNTNGVQIKDSSKKAEFTLYANVEQVQLPPGAKIVFTVDLTARGFVGDTNKSFTFAIAPPKPPNITKIDLSNKDTLSLSNNLVNYNFATGCVRVFYAVKNATANYYEKGVTDYTLQRLVTTYNVNRSIEAALSDGWKDVDTNMGSTSDQKKGTKKTKADAVMGEPIIDVLTGMGFTANAKVYDARVWYRIKCVRQGMTAYSEPKDVPELACKPPTAANDYSGFMAIRNSVREPGTSIDGVVGWANANNNNEGVDNPNWKDAIWTTIVEWSEHREAVHSNQQPSVLEIDWKNSDAKHSEIFTDYQTRTTNKSFGDQEYFKPWQKSASFSIYGLTPGTKYYLWTRRHMVLGEYNEYGPRTKAPADYFPFVPTDNPTKVQVYTEENYIYGRDLLVSWLHDANCDQTAWNIYLIPYKKSFVENQTAVTKIPKKLIACGTGTTNSFKVSAEELEQHILPNSCVYGRDIDPETNQPTGPFKCFTIDRKLCVIVGVSTGGKEIYSCANDKGRYIGANILDIGRIPDGTVGIMTAKKLTHELNCSSGSEDTKVTLTYHIKTKKNGTSTVTLKKVQGNKVTNTVTSEMKCSVDVYDNATNKKILAVSGYKVTGGNEKRTKSVISKSVDTRSTNIKVVLKIDEGTRYVGNNKVKSNISATSSYQIHNDIKSTIDLLSRVSSDRHVVYLFSRTKDVTGVINVFAKHDTWYTLPDGEHLQPAGECVFTTTIYSGSFESTQSALNADEKNVLAYYVTQEKYAYVAKVSTYSHRNMFDGSQYTVQGYLKDTGDESLTSSKTNVTFTHNPSREAHVCGKESIIQGQKVSLNHSLRRNTASAGESLTDNKTLPSPGVEIMISKPDNFVSTDRFDLYRITPDGGVKIQEDCVFGTKIVDKFAPFSNDAILRYGVVTITAEGDMAWREVKYSLKHNAGMRFDWGAVDNMRSLELPFDVSLKDSYTKDVRVDSYLDGSIAANLTMGVKKQSTNKVKIVRYDPAGLAQDPVQFELIRELARYVGTVFFRADNGSAYEGVVEVDGIDESYDSLVSEISFKMTEINPPSENFMPTNVERKINTFVPSTADQNPKGTVSKIAKQVTSVKTTTEREEVEDSLVLEYSGTDKNGNTVRKSDPFSYVTVKEGNKTVSKIFNEVRYSYFKTITGDSYQVSIPYILINLQNASDKDLAAGKIVKQETASKATTIKNNYAIYVKIKAILDGNELSSKYYYYGNMNGTTYNQYLNNTNVVFNAKRKKNADRTLSIHSKLYLVKSEVDSSGTIKISETVNHSPLNGKYNFDMNYEVMPGPIPDNPNIVKVAFKKLTCSMGTIQNVGYRIRLVDEVDSSKTYYDSGIIYYINNKKKFTLNINKKPSVKRGDASIYVYAILEVYLYEQGPVIYPTTNMYHTFIGSKKIKIPSIDGISNIETGTLTKNIEIKKI